MEDCEIIAGEYLKVNEKLHVDYDFVLHISNCDGSDTESVVSKDNTIVLVRISHMVTKKTEVEFQ
jgi:hypothetical protein